MVANGVNIGFQSGVLVVPTTVSQSNSISQSR